MRCNKIIIVKEYICMYICIYNGSSSLAIIFLLTPEKSLKNLNILFLSIIDLTF